MDLHGFEMDQSPWALCKLRIEMDLSILALSELGVEMDLYL